ncbi:MAG: hypothetical protein RXR09_06505, partial [Acidilobus sp.]
TLATAVLGGLGAVALLLGALAEAIGLRGGDVTLYAGLAMLLASAVMLALLLVPARRAEAAPLAKASLNYRGSGTLWGAS